MGTTGISGLATQMADYLSQFQEKQQESLSVGDAATQSGATSSLLSTLQSDSVTISSVGYAKSQDILSLNDVGKSTAADASYLDAYMAGTSSRLSLQNSMNSSLESGMESTMDQVNKAAFWNNPSLRTASMLRTLGSSFQQIFDDLQEMVDEQITKAQEANTQLAAAGEDGATDASTDTAQTQAAAAQSATPTSTESASADTGQASDVSAAANAQAQAAAALAAAAAGVGGEAPATSDQPSISLTV